MTVDMKLIVILHDIMEYLNKSGHDYKPGSLKIVHNMKLNGHSAGSIDMTYNDISGNKYALGSIYRKNDEHRNE